MKSLIKKIYPDDTVLQLEIMLSELYVPYRNAFAIFIG